VSFLFHGHANKRVPEFPTDSFSMLAIAHGVLLFSDIAVAQEVQHRIPRALIDIEQVSRPIRPLHMRILLSEDQSLPLKSAKARPINNHPWIQQE
jgi:hypothetical protein